LRFAHARAPGGISNHARRCRQQCECRARATQWCGGVTEHRDSTREPALCNHRTCTGAQPRSRIAAERRRQAPAPRLRCGISKISNTACVVMRSMPSSPTLPRRRSRRTRQGSAFSASASALASCSSSHHDFGIFIGVVLLRPDHLSHASSAEPLSY
jgi:hypothetical protein